MTGIHPPRAQFLLDAARATFWVCFRGALPSDEPEVLRLLAGLGWHVEAALSKGRTVWLEEELQRTFGLNPPAARAAAREAWDLWMQARLEEVVLPQLVRERAPVEAWVRLEGELGGGGVVLHLAAGSRKMAAWALSEGREPGWVGIFGRRGLPAQGKGAARATWLNRWEAKTRRREENTLPFRWLEDEEALERHLGGGGLALLGVDDPGFQDQRAGTLFGQPTDLPTLPFALATRHPTYLLHMERRRDKTHQARIEVSQDDATAQLAALEADVRRRPGHYAMTLVDRRMRGG